MKKRTVTAVTCGVWLAAIGSAVTLAFVPIRPLEVRQVARSGHARSLDVQAAKGVVDEEPEETLAPQILEMPPLWVVGHVEQRAARADARTRGAAEMQAPGEVIIGPGVVTHSPVGPSESDGGAPPDPR